MSIHSVGAPASCRPREEPSPAKRGRAGELWKTRRARFPQLLGRTALRTPPTGSGFRCQPNIRGKTSGVVVAVEAAVHDNLDRRIGIAHNTAVTGPRVVLDTNVLVAASRSKKGASAKLLSLVGTGRFEICVSVPLLLEYESAILRGLEPSSTEWQARIDILDYLCKVAIRRKIFFLWRPTLRDPKDEMVLETAVAGGCTSIISYNKRDFEGAERFDLTICSPHEFLKTIGALS